MLNLDVERAAQQPWWFTLVDAQGEDVAAVRVQFAPIGRIALRAARRAAGEVYREADLPEGDDAPLSTELLEAAGDALSDALLMAGIIAWEGVGDADGVSAPVTPDNVRLFLADPLRFEALDAAYVRPFILKELEKNGSSPLPNGISAGATPEKAIAGSSAKPIASADASPTETAGDAPIANMSRAAKPG